MGIRRHGISIGIERINEDFFLTFTVLGKLSHTDYEVITPMLESAIAGISQPHIKVLVDCSQFEGWELRALWDDFRLGMRHGSKMQQVAVVGSSKWMEGLTRIGNWFTSADIRYFETIKEALEWLEA